MKIVAPRYKAVSLKGAFRFDSASFEALSRIFHGIVGQEYSTSFSVTMKNGSAYTVDSVVDLEKLPLSDVKSRDVFEAEWETVERPRASMRVQVRYWCPALINISAHSEEQAERIAREASSLVEARRAWYSWIFSYWVFGVLSLPLYGALGVGVWLVTLPRRAVIYVVGWYVAYGLFFGAMYIVRRYLFDTVIIEVGHEALRQLSLARTRSYLFGTLFVGVLIAVLGGAASAWFGN